MCLTIWLVLIIGELLFLIGRNLLWDENGNLLLSSSPWFWTFKSKDMKTSQEHYTWFLKTGREWNKGRWDRKRPGRKSSKRNTKKGARSVLSPWSHCWPWDPVSLEWLLQILQLAVLERATGGKHSPSTNTARGFKKQRLPPFVEFPPCNPRHERFIFRF